MKLPVITDAQRNSAEYLAGDIAFANFVTVDECPYESCGRDGAPPEEGERRMAWLAGWYEANLKATFPKLFDPDHPDYQPEV